MHKRNLNEERFADLTDTRVCKKCNNEKPLKFFPYHSATNCFMRTCQECVNMERRIKYEEKALKEGRILDTTHTLERKKTCIKCGDEKIMKEGFPKRGNAYSNVCKKCVDEVVGKKLI